MHSNSNICRFIFPMWTEWLQDSPLTARQPQIRQNEYLHFCGQRLAFGENWLKYEDSGSRQILVLVPWFRLRSQGVYKLDLTIDVNIGFEWGCSTVVNMYLEGANVSKIELEGATYGNSAEDCP